MEKDNTAKIKELRDYIGSIKTTEHRDSYLIAVLHKAQDLFGYVSQEVMDEISLSMSIPTAHIWGVVTFYHYFSLLPKGKHAISVCMGTACYVKGAEKILKAIKEHLKIEIGQTTTDGVFTLQEARCLGACGLAPVVMIDEKIYGNVTEKNAVSILKEHSRLK
ncbi:MAG: NADH-quinone oxidoreductase subunit NuoE [Candidatus Margulisiibacteriota bacterium]